MGQDKVILPDLGEIEFDFTDDFINRKATFTKETLPHMKMNKLIAREDDRGMLLKDIQSINLPKDKDGNTMFGEHYNVLNPEPMVRAFHGHRKMWDFYCIVMGKAKFVQVDARVSIDGKPNPTYGMYNEVFLSDRNPFVLIVPPGIIHGWKSFVPNTLLSVTSTHLYDPKNLDEVRAPYQSFGYSWDIQIK